MMQQSGSRSSSSSPSTATATPTHPANTIQDPQNPSDTARQAVEDQLNDLLQLLFELSVVVYDFQPDGNRLVWNKMYEPKDG